MGHFRALRKLLLEWQSVSVTLLPIPEGVTVTADHCNNLLDSAHHCSKPETLLKVCSQNRQNYLTAPQDVLPDVEGSIIKVHSLRLVLPLNAFFKDKMHFLKFMIMHLFITMILMILCWRTDYVIWVLGNAFFKDMIMIMHLFIRCYDLNSHAFKDRVEHKNVSMMSQSIQCGLVPDADKNWYWPKQR